MEPPKFLLVLYLLFCLFIFIKLIPLTRCESRFLIKLQNNLKIHLLASNQLDSLKKVILFDIWLVCSIKSNAICMHHVHDYLMEFFRHAILAAHGKSTNDSFIEPFAWTYSTLPLFLNGTNQIPFALFNFAFYSNCYIFS